MITDYNLKREQHYLDIKSSVATLVNGVMLLLILGTVVSFWGLFTDSKVIFICMLVFLIFLISIYSLFAIGLYSNLRVFRQEISCNNIMNNSNEFVLEFLKKKQSSDYKALGIYENEDIIIIEFAPYLIKNKADKYTPVVALMNKDSLKGSTWQTLLKSQDAMKRLKDLRKFANKNEETKLRYLGNQFYYFSYCE
ncbi:UNVERIFIED_ORG: hypothetical protein ABIC58_001115 [Leuconostoc holzapfelii]